MDTSYLLEILTTGGISGDEYLPDVNAKMLEIVQQINTLKKDVKNVLDSGYPNFTSHLKENDVLVDEAHQLSKQFKDINQFVLEDIKPEISSCTVEIENFSSSLQEINLSLDILNQLIDFHTILKHAKLKISNKEYFDSSKSIKSLQEMIEIHFYDLKNLEMYQEMSQEVNALYDQLVDEVNEMWSFAVTFSTKEDSDFNTTTLHVNSNSYKDISDILKTVDCLKFESLAKNFGEKFISKIAKEIIFKKSEIFDLDGETASLTIKSHNKEKKPYYLNVFENVTKVLQFLNLNFHVRLNDYNFLILLGQTVAEEFMQLLIENCLSDTIPTNSRDLKRYNEVVNDINSFEVFLKECGFLQESNTSLMEYAKNINFLFANKLCQSYCSKARIIMKKDLHDLDNSNEIILSNINVLSRVQQNILKEKLRCQDKIIKLPKCQISKSAIELLNLLLEMMDEVVKDQAPCALRLFYTVRNIMEMYSAIVPLHHKKFLDTLPHHVAIFHNNCLYFTYQLLQISCEYKKKIPATLKGNFTLLLEEAISLRNLAKETLEEHISEQGSQLIFIIRDSGLATLIEEPDLDPKSEKNIRQCMRHLNRLQTAWQGVLPNNMYNKAMGFLLDTIIDELVLPMFFVLDIGSKTSTILADIFTIITDKAPNLFQEPGELVAHTKKWHHFQEFLLVLKGNLHDIDQRWLDGNGPLAKVFTSEQVKHLVRALFQNSEKRAALLAKIK